MQWVGLVESPDHVCCRYRLSAFRPALERAGHNLELRLLPQSLGERFRIGADPADAVVLQRKLLSDWQLYLLRRRTQRLVFDFDDAVWLRDSYAPRGIISFRRMNRFRSMMRSCDHVVAGNAFLAEHARNWAKEVTIIPTCVDETTYPMATHESDSAIRLVWIGSSSTLQGLERTRPLLDAVGGAVPGVRLRVVCDRFPQFDKLAVEECPWNADREAADLASSDVGISWVPDDPWSRGKCGLKVLQYMAAGLPVVANPVGVQAEMVLDGVTGFLATSHDDWIDAVRTLARDPALRRRMGEAGRRVVEADYSVSAGAAKWLRLIDGSSHQRKSA